MGGQCSKSTHFGGWKTKTRLCKHPCTKIRQSGPGITKLKHPNKQQKSLAKHVISSLARATLFLSEMREVHSSVLLKCHKQHLHNATKEFRKLDGIKFHPDSPLTPVDHRNKSRSPILSYYLFIFYKGKDVSRTNAQIAHLVLFEDGKIPICFIV
jgi:hypothetical protein